MKCIVSVIIPTYNRADLIVESLESVLAQTYTNLEVIVVDDGSTDQTRSVLEPYAGKIKYIRQANLGVSAARNRGLQEASGEFVAFQDSDDLWLAGKLEWQVEFLLKNLQYDLVCGNGVFLTDERLYIDGKRLDAFRKEGLNLKTVYLNGHVPPPTILVRKEAAVKVGGFDPRLSVVEDWDFLLRFLLEFKGAFLDRVLFKCRIHSGNISADKVLNQLQVIHITDQLFQSSSYAVEIIGRRNIQEKLAHAHYKLGRFYFDCGENLKAIAAFRSALNYRPIFPSCLFRYLCCKVRFWKTGLIRKRK